MLIKTPIQSHGLSVEYGGKKMEHGKKIGDGGPPFANLGVLFINVSLNISDQCSQLES